MVCQLLNSGDDMNNVEMRAMVNEVVGKIGAHDMARFLVQLAVVMDEGAEERLKCGHIGSAELWSAVARELGRASERIADLE